MKVKVVGTYDILSINKAQTHSMNKTEDSLKYLQGRIVKEYSYRNIL